MILGRKKYGIKDLDTGLVVTFYMKDNMTLWLSATESIENNCNLYRSEVITIKDRLENNKYKRFIIDDNEIKNQELNFKNLVIYEQKLTLEVWVSNE